MNRIVGIPILAVLPGLPLLIAAGAQEGWYPSRYGPDDELGALNEVTPHKVRDAVRLVTAGKVYDLGQVYEDGIPAYPPRYWKTWVLFQKPGGELGINKLTGLTEVNVGIDHVESKLRPGLYPELPA